MQLIRKREKHINCRMVINHKTEANWSKLQLFCVFLFTALTNSLAMARTSDEPMINIVTSSTIASVTTQTPPVIDVQSNSSCFYAEPELCYLPNDNDSCKECIPHPIVPNSLVCCNVTDIEKSISCVQNPSSDNSSYWTNIHIRNATLDELDISYKFWKRMESFSITDGHVKRIIKEFPKFSSPKCINISNNNLLVIQPRAFKDLTPLQYLDISYNNLSLMPNLNSIQTNLSVDVRGNEALLCKSVLESTDRANFVEPNISTCLMNQTFNWFNSTEKIPLSQLNRMKQLQSECPRIPNGGNCTCNPERMSYEEQVNGVPQLVFAVKVDCSNMGLTELPKTLPMMTISLNISNNNITSLNEMTTNAIYDNLLRLYADDNQINSLLDLEGSKFIEAFDTFFLRRNKLIGIPTYVLSNILDKSPDGRLLYLEGNQLTCDCNSATHLKLWLLARHNHITDSEKIGCNNMPQKVLELNEMRLCQSPHDWTDYIYFLIAAEVMLLMALIMKVSYDAWIFKTAGYLPWPASQMPKLPCDWLCES